MRAGRLAYQLADHFDGGSYSGFDIAPDPIEWLEREYTSRRPNFHFDLVEVRNDRYRPDGSREAASIRSPYDDGRFDYVCVHDVFVHMRQPAIDHYLHEAYRVLRPGGRLLMTFMAIVDPDNPGEWSGRSYERVAEGTYTGSPSGSGSRWRTPGISWSGWSAVPGSWSMQRSKAVALAVREAGEGKVPGADLSSRPDARGQVASGVRLAWP